MVKFRRKMNKFTGAVVPTPRHFKPAYPPYVKPKEEKKRVSFTQQLRNAKGYADYLAKKYNLVKASSM